MIMNFDDKFQRHLLPDQLHQLNVSFLVSQMRREFGGCAGNIAYNLHLLDPSAACPMGTIGKDFSDYAQWMDQKGITREYLRTIESEFTAQAYITTDDDGNQITIFHPGAMNHSHENRVSQASDISIGIVSPDGRQGMIDHATQFSEADIPFIFDPGQGMPMFNSEDLIQFMEQATWMIFNNYEFELFKERTKKTLTDIRSQVSALIVTRGEAGAMIYTNDKNIEIPSVKASAVIDPTGCGDAFRGGLLFGILNDLDWDICGKLGALMGAYKIASYGTQNHWFEKSAFMERLKFEFGNILD
ncbi:MAG: adenosine kinase [Candidatus Magnetoglobus multicellularis str. Araruama]|uniref:Adenosine kinase n=1 Tax=Candidatus Magnetoglobus multicellularis str. Araruama TaxID=890399 RepID=A0A1V1NZJ4_9BACT|nr:MAG: adenosine kinase [Candidatus Magnetoglobus multicellularis str. Araruama]